MPESSVTINIGNGDSWTFTNPQVAFYPPVGEKVDNNSRTMVVVLPLGSPEARSKIREAITAALKEHHNLKTNLWGDWLDELCKELKQEPKDA